MWNIPVLIEILKEDEKELFEAAAKASEASSDALGKLAIMMQLWQFQLL